MGFMPIGAVGLALLKLNPGAARRYFDSESASRSGNGVGAEEAPRLVWHRQGWALAHDGRG
jgi:hypothetical protein